MGKGVPADVLCPLGCLGYPSGHLSSQIPPCLSPNGLSHIQSCHHGEDTPTLEDLTLRETQLAPQSRFWGTTPTWGHPTQYLTPHELSVVFRPLGSGDTCPGMFLATSWGCSRYEGSARTWRYPPSAPVLRWRMGTLQGGGTCPVRAWGHSGITAQDGDMSGLWIHVLQPPHLPPCRQLSACRQLISILSSSSCSSSILDSLCGKKENWNPVTLVTSVPPPQWRHAPL